MKMNRLQASFLGLLLCSVILMASSYGPNKSGECPKERRYTPKMESNATFCQNDGECDGVKKCCLDHDSRFCKMPAAERPGSCPNPSEIPSKSDDDMCTSDSECAPKAKCCKTNRGNTCWPSVGDKEGDCPLSNIQCFAPVRSFCNTDTECSSDEKCCNYECSRVCMPPKKSTNKSGECPKERRYTPKRELNVTFCQNDGECDGVKKCCLDHDSRTCKMPAAERPGSCPNPSKITSKSDDDMCTSDSECAPKAKCCKTKRGNICWPSVGDKEGDCPLSNMQCFAPVRSFCNTDTECSSDEKCCNYECSRVCMPPKKKS